MLSPRSEQEHLSRGPGRGRALNLPALAVILVGIALAGYLITRPVDEVVLDRDCSPEDIQAQLSAWFYGNTFWQKQQAALTDEIETLQDMRNEAKQGPARPAGMTPIEARMRRLSERARAIAAVTDDQIWREEILTLGRCEGVVGRRLAH